MKKSYCYKRVISVLMIITMLVTLLPNYMVTKAEEMQVLSTATAESYTGPLIGGDGSVTFRYQGKGTETTVQVKGGWDASWGDIRDLVKGDNNVWTCTLPNAPMQSFEYGFMVDGTYINDSSNKTNNGSKNSKINRNPQFNEDGSVTIYYYPDNYDNTIKVLYREKNSSDNYSEVLMQRDSTYSDIYSANLNLNDGTYEYKLEVDENIVEDINTSSAEFAVTKVPDIDETVKSPVVNGGLVTFHYYAPTAKEVYVAGSFTNWGTNKELMNYNKETGYWSLTKELSVGSYEYKFVVDNQWYNDPLNSEYSGGNSLVKVTTVEESTIKSPVIDSEKKTVTFNYKPSGAYKDTTSVALMGTLTDWNNGKEMVKNDEGIFTITLSLEPGSYEYKFKIDGTTWITDPLNNKLSSDNNSLVVMPGMEIGGNNPAGVGDHPFTATMTASSNGAVTDETNNVSWSIEGDIKGATIHKGILTTTKETPNGYIPIVVEYTDGAVTKVQKRSVYYTNRALIFQYEGSNLQANADIYVWYNSIAENVGYSFLNVNGIKTSYVTIGDGNNIEPGFIIRLYGAWGTGDREFADRTVKVNSGEAYTKVRAKQGDASLEVLPSGKTYFDQGIIFNYRDDQLFYENRMNEITSVNVIINGKSYPMSYSEKDELFTFAYQNIEEGDYEYYFEVTMNGTTTYVKDQYNANTVNDHSLLTYSIPNITIEASTYPTNISYDQNAVLSLKINSDSDTKVKEIYADLTELGAGSKVSISTESLEGIVYASDKVTAGVKNIPITVVDQYGNLHRSNGTITVTANNSSNVDWDEARIYFLLTDRFHNGDTTNDGITYQDMAEAYHGGDFAGLTKKLDYLEDLGINTIWITPIVDNIDHIVNEDIKQSGYHGYWAKDFTVIDEHLGTVGEFKTLLDEAHQRGMKIMVDVVLNHAGYDTVSGESELTAFDGMLRTNPGSDNLTQELSGLPDFMTEVKEVRDKLIAWQTSWAELTTEKGNQIDYFRVDTVKHVDHETWKDFKAALTKVNPNFKLIGEYFGASIDSNGDYLGNGEMDSLLDFDFKSVAKNFVNGSIDQVETVLENRNSKLTNYSTMGQFLSSHDEDGFLYSIGNDTSKMKLAAALQITAKGQPVIYYGEEVNLTGPNSFGVLENNRYDMQFENLTTEQQEMLTHYTKLLKIRAGYSKIFSKGDRMKLAGSDTEQYLVFDRSYKMNHVIVGLNTTTTEKTVTFTVPFEKDTVLIDRYNNVEYVVDDQSQITVTIPASIDGGTIILSSTDTAYTPYSITVTNGTASPSNQEVGKEVTVTANNPVTGMKFKEWNVEKGTITPIHNTTLQSSKMTFIMPDEKVSITAVYEQEVINPSPTPSTPTTPATPDNNDSKESSDIIKDINNKLNILSIIKITLNNKIAGMDISLSESELARILSSATTTNKFNLSISIPKNNVLTLLNDNSINGIKITLHIPEKLLTSDNILIHSIPFSQDILSAMIKNKKDIAIEVVNDTGKVYYAWDIKATNLIRSKKKLTDINLLATVSSTETNSVINTLLKKNNYKKGLLIALSSNDILPSMVTVKVPISAIGNLQSGDKVYVYRYNKETNKLDTIVGGYSYKVDSDGYVSLEILSASDYVILPKKASSSIITSLLNQVKLSKKYTLEAGDTKTLMVTLPITLEKVKDIKEETASSAIGQAVIQYKSSNKKIASVDKNTGKITAKKTGSTTITVTIKLYNGKTKNFKIAIVVKK